MTKLSIMFFHRAAYGVFLGTIFLLIVTVLPPFPSTVIKSFIAITGISLSALFWFLGLLKDRRIKLPRSLTWLGLGLVMVTTLLSTMFADGITKSLFGNGHEVSITLFTLVLGLTMGLSAVLLVNRPSRLYGLLLAIGSGFIIIFGFQLFAFIFGPLTGVGLGSTAVNLLGKWNELAVFSGLILLVALTIFELEPLNRSYRLTVVVVGIVALALVALVNFTLVWVLLAIACFLLGGILLILKRRHETLRQRLVRPVIGIFLIALIFIFFGRPDQSLYRLLSRATTALQVADLEVRPSPSGTWMVGQALLADHPWLGTGPNTFATIWARYKPISDVNATEFWNVDFNFGYGTVPTLALTTGGLGLLGWTAFSLLLFGEATLAVTYILSRRRPATPLILPLFASLYLYAAASTYVVSSALLVLGFVFSGVFIATWSVARRNFVRLNLPRAVTLPLSLGLVAIVILTATRAYGAYEVYRGETLWRAGDIDQALSYYDRATKRVKSDDYERWRAEVNRQKIRQVVNQTSQTVDEATMAVLIKSAETAVAAARRATELNKNYYRNWLSLGEVYEDLASLKLPGAEVAAIEGYEMALKQSPSSPIANLGLARVYAHAGETDKARLELEEVLRKKPNQIDARRSLTELNLSHREFDQAREHLELLAELLPTDATIWFTLGYTNYQLKLWLEALQALKQALSLQTNYADATYFLALTHEASGDRASAIALLETLVKSNPDNQEVTRTLKRLRQVKE